MPIYAKFIDPYPVFSGGVTVGAHAGWSRLQTFEFGLARPAGGPQAAQGSGGVSLHDILVTKTTDAGSRGLFSVGGWDPVKKAKITGEPEDPTVRIDFTRADGRGGEATELSITLHGVVMEKEYTNPRSGGRSAAAERYRIRYRKITYSNMPPSSADVSHVVKGALMRAGPPQCGPTESPCTGHHFMTKEIG
jgi:type VI protein secretion system component Hcp